MSWFEILKQKDIDLVLPQGKQMVLKADDKKYERGLLVKLLKSGAYEMAYWYDEHKPYPIEILVDGKSVKKDAKKVTMKFHPELKKSVFVKRIQSPEAKRHKVEYDTQYESSPKRVKYREELNQERRKRGMYGDGSHRDISHTQGNKLTVEDEHDNRARHFKGKGTLRPVKKAELKRNGVTVTHDECKDIEEKILREVEKEGGALGMKNLKGIAPPQKLEMVLQDMMKRGKIKEHRHGDFYTDQPNKKMQKSCDCEHCAGMHAAIDLLEKKLCPAGKAAAKRKFKVYPSAYANGWAVQYCRGKFRGKKKGKKK
tara:strand:- start:2600 stop:3538 length:939 start_codon:yes stop_codon:yes gene_type:complete